MRSVALTFIVVLALLLGPTSAQTVAASFPSDPQLVIRTPDNQLTFHIGEVIPLELVFTSVSHDKYQLDMASYDQAADSTRRNLSLIRLPVGMSAQSLLSIVPSVRRRGTTKL